MGNWVIYMKFTDCHYKGLPGTLLMRMYRSWCHLWLFTASNGNFLSGYWPSMIINQDLNDSTGWHEVFNYINSLVFHSECVITLLPDITNCLFMKAMVESLQETLELIIGHRIIENRVGEESWVSWVIYINSLLRRWWFESSGSTQVCQTSFERKL